MKTLINTIAVTALVGSFAAPSFANVEQEVQAIAATNGNIRVQVLDDTVTLTGYVDDTYSRQLAERTAKQEGYKVENYLLLNN